MCSSVRIPNEEKKRLIAAIIEENELKPILESDKGELLVNALLEAMDWSVILYKREQRREKRHGNS